MRSATCLLATALFTMSAAGPSDPAPTMRMNKATPLITVDAIEPCLPFWTEALGFELTATVPHGDSIGFAMLQSGGVELMYQSRASVDADLGTSGAPEGLGSELARSTATLFVDVDDLGAVLSSLGALAEVIVPRRKTFYVMDEVLVSAPCGTFVGFVARLPEE